MRLAPRPTLLVAASLVIVITSACTLPYVPQDVSIGDAAEAQTVPYILGIAHPTGFPAYVLAGWLVSHALAVGTIAWRLNVLAVLGTAVGAAGVAVLGIELGAPSIAAVCAAATFAFGPTIWRDAITANAQTFSAACSVLVLASAVAFANRGKASALLTGALAAGVGIAAHPAAIWSIPALVVAVAYRRDVSPRIAMLAVLSLVTPLLLYAYLPLRSAIIAAHGLDPAAGAPLFGSGEIDWGTKARHSLAGFADEVFARNENAGESLVRAFDVRALPQALTLWFAQTRAQYDPIFRTLAVFGFGVAIRHNSRAIAVLIAGTIGGIAFAYVYRLDANIERYTFVSLAMLAAVAAASAAPIAGGVTRGMARTLATLLLAASVAICLMHGAPAMPATADGEPIIAAIAASMPPNAIVVAQWNDAAALAYAAYAEHKLAERTIVSEWPGDDDARYPQWARSRPVALLLSRMDLHRGFALRQTRVFPVHFRLRGYQLLIVLPPDRRTAGSPSLRPIVVGFMEVQMTAVLGVVEHLLCFAENVRR